MSSFSSVGTLAARLCVILVIVCGLSAATLTAGSFGDDGLYKVIIEKSGLPTKTGKNAAETALPKTVTMFNRKGQPFRCSLPEMPKPANKQNSLNISMDEIRKALATGDTKTATTGDCVSLLSNGWWHYEYCYSKKVSQFHIEGDRIVPPLISMGIFSHDFDWSQVSDQDALKKTDRFHTQFFTNGSECDLTGQKRSTRVKIYCNANTQHRNKDFILKVEEPESCVYEVTVFSSRLCGIDYFNKQPQPVGKIVCSPVVEEVKSEGKKGKPASGNFLHVEKSESKFELRTERFETSSEEDDEDDYYDENDVDYDNENPEKPGYWSEKVDGGQVGLKRTETLPQPPKNRHGSPKSKDSSSSYRPFRRASDKGLFDRGSRSSSRRPPPQSKAQTFDDVLLDMSPAGQRLRAIQKLIAQQLGPAAAFMDVQFMDEPNGAEGDLDAVLEQMDSQQMAKFQQVVAQAFAGIQEHEAAFVLEGNYNMEDEEELRYYQAGSSGQGKNRRTKESSPLKRIDLME